jgi:hypothetical protein
MEAATQERLAVPVSDHDHSDGPTDAATTLVVYVQYAAQLGLAEAGVRQALRTRATAGRIAQDVRSGQASNVRGTPALFINGLRYRGKRDTTSLDAALRLPSTATVIPIQTTGEPTDEPTKRVNRRRPLGDGASDE